MEKVNPYVECPIYETESFIFRLVEENDAKDLFECYSDIEAVKFMNSDTCINNFYYTTMQEMRNCIRFWLDCYASGGFVRLCIIDKKEIKSVGTIEIFGGEYGVLRIDILPVYEKEKYINEILDLSIKNFYDAFDIKNIVIKAIPSATERLSALKNFHFEADMQFRPNMDYYFRKQ
ncbi:MAG: hypothetical protein K0S55_2050 [Clostridia bacterium]|nr:hypothetical protein [Clostridia bacterium]